MKVGWRRWGIAHDLVSAEHWVCAYVYINIINTSNQGYCEWIMHQGFKSIWFIQFSSPEHHISKSPSQGILMGLHLFTLLGCWINHTHKNFVFCVWSGEETKWPNRKCNISSDFKDNGHYGNKKIMGALHKEPAFLCQSGTGGWSWIAINCNGVPFCAARISLSYIFLAAGRKQRTLFKGKQLCKAYKENIHPILQSTS